MEKCNHCSKTVYQLERVQIASDCVLHKLCFKCHKCSTILRLNNYSKSMGGLLFCLPHYRQLFLTKGNYDEAFGHQQHKERWIKAGQLTTTNKI